jgi:hypothetical protein
MLASAEVFCGSLLRGSIGLVLPEIVGISGLTLAWLSPLLGMFALSDTARVVVLLVLLPKIREVRKVRPISFSNVIFRVTRVHALAGLVFDIVGARPKPVEEAKKEKRD